MWFIDKICCWQSLKALSPLYRYSVSIGAVSCLSIVWFFYPYRYGAQRIDKVRVIIQQMRKKAAEIPHARVAHKAVLESVARLHFHHEGKRVPQEQFSLFYVTERAIESGLRSVHCACARRQHTEGHQFQIQAVATLEALCFFMQLLAQQEAFVCSELLLASEQLPLYRCSWCLELIKTI